MKKSFILLSAIALGLFSSCSDDDSADSAENSLMGSWQLTAEYDNGEPYELDNCELEETIIFKSDGIYEFVDYDPAEGNENECVVDDDSSTGTWSIPSSGKLSISEGSIVIVTDYSISGNQLTITFEEEYEGETWTSKSIYKKK
ncbi:lipocalin-like protein [Flavobacteriaceae bacterium MAR_2009_75]|nr:lipocalin-like protein [Flavobacteriaceae bacterium MAR_2009_75]